MRRDPEIQNTWNFSNMIALNISICTVCKFFAKSFAICILAAKDSKMMIETYFFFFVINNAYKTKHNKASGILYIISQHICKRSIQFSGRVEFLVN